MKLRLGIRSKLIGIINFILIAAAATIVVFATNLFSRDNTARIQESNLDTARLLADQIHDDLINLTEKMRHLGVTLMLSLSPNQLDALQKPFFEQEKDLLSEAVFRKTPGGSELVGKASNDALMKSTDVTSEELASTQSLIPAVKLFSGSEFILSGILRGSIPVVTIGIPLVTDESGTVTHAIVATIKQDRFLKSVTSAGITISYLVDSEGFVLAHPDQDKVLKHVNLKHFEIVKQLTAGKIGNGQTRFIDPENLTPYLGAFKTVGFSGIGVVSQVEEAKALEAARKVRTTSILITGIVAVFAFLFVFFYSLSLTNPLLRLVDATNAISQGNYEVTLKRPSHDEIGDLTDSFNHMAQGLAEREKIKNAFSKFHSKDIAEKILSGDLKLQGERKKVSIFFSDIRSFTSISEKLEPEQVVELVNSYMTRMVRIIFAHGGVVDKYVGDAIMAVYGTPVSHGDDSLRAVSAALRMREELKRYNESQAQTGRPVIAIGMGMHTGDVVAGNIGSPERMEYTILGDNVNLTSRMESLTKEYKTDILISESTYEEIKDHIECVARGGTKVKGKAEEVQVFEVIGFKAGCEYIPPEGSTGETVMPPPAPQMVAAPQMIAAPMDSAPPPFDRAEAEATREISRLIEIGTQPLPGAEDQTVSLETTGELDLNALGKSSEGSGNQDAA